MLIIKHKLSGIERSWQVFSNSIQKAQTISVCQFCEESSIEWKCINCNLFLCQLCNRRIHSKLTITNEHHVINLSDCGSEDAVETSRKLDLDKLTCTLHSEQNCVLYCKNCERSVCSDCLIKDHKNHDFCKMNYIYDSKLKVIKDMKQEIESGILYFKGKEENLGQALSDGKTQYTDNREKIIEIKEKTIEFKDDVVKYVDCLLSDLDKEWILTEDTIKKELDSVRQRNDGLEERKSQLDQTLSSSSASGIFVTSNCLDKSMPDKTVRCVELKERKFIPGKISSQPISALFGGVYDVPDFQLVQTYSFESLSYLLDNCKLIKCDRNSAIVANMSTLHKVKLEKCRIINKRKVELQVYDMTMMNTGDLLISSKEQDLKLFPNDIVTGSQIKIFKSFAPLYTLGVHVNKQNEIFVGLSDDNEDKPTEDSVGKVVQINQKGVILNTYEYGTNNKKLFTWPTRICTNNQYIYVVDYIGVLDLWSRSGRVVVIDKGGQLQGIYYSSFDKFHPSDIAVTSTDLVIVTDSINHALHVLIPTGELILCKVVSDIGIIKPFSISICKEDDEILIATWNSKIHALKL